MTKKKKIKLFLAPGRKAKKASAARQNPKTQFKFQTYEAGCNKVTFESVRTPTVVLISFRAIFREIIGRWPPPNFSNP